MKCLDMVTYFRVSTLIILFLGRFPEEEIRNWVFELLEKALPEQSHGNTKN